MLSRQEPTRGGFGLRSAAGTSVFDCREFIKMTTRLRVARSVAANIVTFELPAYDHSQPLVIDPVLSYATVFGGGGADQGRVIAVDASGASYVAGIAGSSNFPVVKGQYLQSGSFLAKISPAGDAHRLFDVPCFSDRSEPRSHCDRLFWQPILRWPFFHHAEWFDSSGGGAPCAVHRWRPSRAVRGQAQLRWRRRSFTPDVSPELCSQEVRM